MTAQFSCSDFEKRMNNVDPDFRHMALYDLQRHMQHSTASLDHKDVGQYAQFVVKSFTDKERNTDVVNMAVRVVGPLCLRANENLQEFILVQLAQQVFNTKIDTKQSAALGVVPMTVAEISLVRENCLLAMKLAVDEFKTRQTAPGSKPIGLSAVVAATKVLVAQLKGPRDASIDERIRADTYDLLTDFVAFGGMNVSAQDGDILKLCLDELAADLASRKRATSCLAALCPRLSDEQFTRVITALETGLNKKDTTTIGKYIQACSVIAKSVTAAGRFGSKVASITHILVSEIERLRSLPEDARDSPESDDTRELILGAIESFVANCTSHMRTDVILPVTLQLLAWDPNLVVNNATDFAEEEDDGFEFEGTDDYEMDDEANTSDSSWRVRKAAAKTLGEVVRRLAQPEDLATILRGPHVHRAIQDGVEQVKLESLTLLSTLIGVTALTALPLLTEVAPALHKDLLALLAKYNAVANAAAMSALRSLLARIGADAAAPLLNGTVGTLLEPSIAHRSLADATPVLREVLLIAQRLPPAMRQQHHSQLTRILVHLTKVVETSTHYKEVLLALEALRGTIPLLASTELFPLNEVTALYQVLLVKTTADGELRKLALEISSAILVARTETIAVDLRVQGKRAFINLMRGEITQARAAEAFTASTNNGIPADLIREGAERLTELLRKADQETREAAMTSLTRLLEQPDTAKHVPAKVIDKIVVDLAGLELVKLLDERDLVSAGHALKLAKSLPPSVAPQLKDNVYPVVVRLLDAPLAPPSMVDAAAAFARTLAPVMPPDAVANLVAQASTLSPALASFVAGLVAGLDPKMRQQYIKKCEDSKTLLLLGCLGCYEALSANAMKLLLAGLASKDEAVQQSAAVGVGRAMATLASGPQLLKLVSEGSQGSDVLSLLRGLREALSHTQHQLDPQVHVFAHEANRLAAMQLLLRICQSHNDDLQDSLSDLIGRLLSLDPQLTETAVNAANTSSSAFTRTVVICAARYLFTKETTMQAAQTLITAKVVPLLASLQRTAALPERKACVQLLNAMLTRRPSWIAPDKRESILGALVAELAIDESLVTEVDLGPFKHRVDSGLELRKLSFDAASALLRAPSNFFAEASTVLPLLGKQLCDSLTSKNEDNEILSTVRLLLAKLLKRFPAAVDNEWLAPTVAKLSAAITAAVKEGQDVERHQQGVCAAIRCAEVLSARAAALPALTQLMTTAKASPLYSRAKQEMQAEAEDNLD